MPAPESEPTVRVHILIFKKDWERLAKYFGDTIGASKAIRDMLKRQLDALDSRVQRTLEAEEPAPPAREVQPHV